MARSEESEEEYHSLGSGNEPDGDGDGDGDGEPETMEPPKHPVPSMQGAFEESIIESTDDSDPSDHSNLDAGARRQKLLESKQYDDTWAARWKQKPTAQYHPLLKLMSQIVFGMHLLQQQQAKSEAEVVKILQKHVNEVDTFLENTAEDFDLAIKDIEERIRFLKLPMTHQDVFEVMLDDKKFRTQLFEGNDKIEKIIDRTSKAMNATLLDVIKAIKATKELGRYLDGVNGSWPRDKRSFADVYGAMRGNEQGWKKYLSDLQIRGNHLGQHLVQLSTLIGEMSKLAAAASRRNKTQSKVTASGSKSAPSSPGLRSRFAQDPTPPLPTSSHSNHSDLNKPLPEEPAVVTGASQTASSKPHPVPFSERYERPRDMPAFPEVKVARVASISKSNGIPQRPKTAGGIARDARVDNSRSGTADLAEFLKLHTPQHHNPLRSNPPDMNRRGTPRASIDRKLGRSASQGANLMLNQEPASTDRKPAPWRSRSQGAMDILNASEQGKSQPANQQGGFIAVRASSEQEMKDALPRTGFARRLSKRMKHLPTPEDVPPEQEQSTFDKTSPPPDSAYASGTDKRSPQRELKPPEQARPESTIGPLPVRNELPDATNNRHIKKTSDSPSVKSLAATSKSGSLSSFRSVFSRGRGKIKF